MLLILMFIIKSQVGRGHWVANYTGTKVLPTCSLISFISELGNFVIIIGNVNQFIVECFIPLDVQLKRSIIPCTYFSIMGRGGGKAARYVLNLNAWNNKTSHSSKASLWLNQKVRKSILIHPIFTKFYAMENLIVFSIFLGMLAIFQITIFNV